jgi:hypothetical protein
MKKKTGGIMKLIPGAIFMIAVFVMFALNIAEAAGNYMGNKEDSGLRSVVSDLESVDRATYPFVNVNGLYQNLMQRNYMYDADSENDTIKTTRGQLASVSSSVSKKKMKASVAELAETRDRLSAQGIPLLYVQAPGKLGFSEEGPMPGLENNTYEKLNRFLAELDKADIEYVDTREWMSETGPDGFYDTDHHWTVETCFDIASRLGSLLNSEYGFNINEEALDASNYDFDTHKDAFLGAEGRRTGRYYAGLDDFTVITPAFDTDFHVEIESKETGHSERDGSFEETIMDSTKDTVHYSFDDSAYYAYWGGDYGRAEAINNKIDDDSSIVVIKDSYGIPVTAFLTNMFHKVNVIDIRYYESDKKLRDVIAEADPDMVMFIYGSGYLGKKKMFKIK